MSNFGLRPNASDLKIANSVTESAENNQDGKGSSAEPVRNIAESIFVGLSTASLAAAAVAGILEFKKYENGKDGLAKGGRSLTLARMSILSAPGASGCNNSEANVASSENLSSHKMTFFNRKKKELS